MRALAAVAVSALVVSSMLTWIAAPIRGGISGMDVEAGIALPVGWWVVVVAGIGGTGWWLRSRGLVALCGLAGVGLGGYVVLHVVFGNPLFWSLLDENAQYADIMNFSWRYLPANMGIEPTFRMGLSADTPIDRLVTALYFIGRGWWLCMAGSLLAFVIGVRSGRGDATRWAAAGAVVLLAGVGLMAASGFAAHHHIERGDRGIAQGEYAGAIARYDAALRWDPQMAGSEPFQLRLGEMYARLGMTAHPVARLYLGDREAREGKPERAVSEYLLAAREAQDPLRAMIERRVALTYIRMGLAQYRKGNAGQAIDWWERALAYDPTRIHAAYMLARVYFDQGRDEQSIAMGRLVLSQSRNRLLNANVEANIGDAYWKLNDGQRARAAYEASMKLDPHANFRIFKSLGGT